MLRILYYLCKKSGKIRRKRGVGLCYVMGVYYIYVFYDTCDVHMCIVDRCTAISLVPRLPPPTGSKLPKTGGSLGSEMR